MQPNVIIINCDDVGYGDLGCYGSVKHDTPSINGLAAEGMRLTNFYVASPVCSPSRGALLTGCYPPRIGFDEFDGREVLRPGDQIGLSQEETTIARLLQSEGYATQIIGKWHCGDQPEFLPTRHGFDSWYGLPYSNDMGRQVPPAESFPPLPLMLDEAVIEVQPDQATLTARYLEESIRFLRDTSDRPFFLYFSHMYVHIPLYVQSKFLESSRNGPYGAAIACIDWALAVLLNEVQALGKEDDTIVIFTSDNGALCRPGEGSNAPLNGTKGTCWEGGQRVPCIVRWPSKVPAGSTSAEITTAMDLLPTIARWCGAAPADRIIDGHDITKILQGDTNATSPYDAFFYYNASALEAVRVGKWKLHLHRRGTWKVAGPGAVLELYDLEIDVGETTNVASDHPDVVAELQEYLERARSDLGDSVTGIEGTGRREKGRVSHARPLATFDPEHPYYQSEYDLADQG